MGKSRRKISRKNKAKKLKTNTRKAKKARGSWEVTFTDGTKVNMGYYPNPRMAVGKALAENPGKEVKDVKYKKKR